MKNLLAAIGASSVLLTVACAPQSEKPHIIHTELSASEAQAQEEAAEMYGQTADFINNPEFSAPADIPEEGFLAVADNTPIENTIHYQANDRNITAVYKQQGNVPMVQLNGHNLHEVLPQTEILHDGAVYSNGKHTWHTHKQRADWTHNQQTLILTVRP